MSGQTPSKKKFTTPSFAQYKEEQKRIVMCTAYDATQARLVEAAGVDVILVGDSLGMTTLGFDSTLPVTMDDMLRATAAVAKGAPQSYIVADMPFMSYQHSLEVGMQNAAALAAQAGASAVKVEGASAETLFFIESVVAAGIPVIGHLGLTPQSINRLGSYATQAKEVDDIVRLMMDAHAIMTAGVSAIVLECVPAEVGQELSEMHMLPIIGIGSGPHCDGEVQVFHDIMGLSDFSPRHARRYLKGAELLTKALEEYVHSVRVNDFPTDAQSTSIDPEILDTATPVFVEHLIEQVEAMDGSVEFFEEEGMRLEPDFDADPEDSQRFFRGGSNAHLN
ncbi:MAG: 3-methyl-2-oxobutanoate hydroxymethyltransferase [Coriobacteriia bacterium]|nr:3-methyl-2-oxobutanoate hydroxymethyltransferase [Coriobacteriia bacterium]MCL2537537.1 3-methyl-2-oxobutanoate hydroxymethyltransferase [Coriobacteriia bacterium]